MADVAALLADLAEESAELDALVAPLDDAGWMTATPSAGWTVAHQIGHLAWTDDVAVLAVTDPDAFQEAVSASLAAGATAVDDAASARALTPPAELLSSWRTGRKNLVDALTAMRPGARIHWFGPPMSATSMATARLMETWAHGQDVADALGVTRPTTARLRHIAHLGVRARNFAFAVNEVDAPEDAFFVELTGPQGEVWSWGPADATQRVTGTATDFALLVTRRRHRADLALTAVGADADRWLDLAQAFAGPPGEGRSPRDAS